MDANLFNALVAAARVKGGPLSDSERHAVVRAATQAHDREYWAKRLHAVVILAGYSAGYAASVVAEYLDRLHLLHRKTWPGFIKVPRRTPCNKTRYLFISTVVIVDLVTLVILTIRTAGRIVWSL